MKPEHDYWQEARDIVADELEKIGSHGEAHRYRYGHGDDEVIIIATHRALLAAEQRGKAAAGQQMEGCRAAAEEAYWLMAYNWQSHLFGPSARPFDMSIFAPEARSMMTHAEVCLFDALSALDDDTDLVRSKIKEAQG